MVKKHLFIALEALDGVGKSTVIRLLGQNSNIRIFTTPSNLFKPLRKLFDCVDKRLRFIFYLTSVIYASERIKRWIKEKPVVCNRYLLSTLSAHQARDVSEKWFTLMNPIIKRVYPPDYTILLGCNEAVRLQRLKERKLTRSDRENLRRGISRQIFIGYKKWVNELGYKLIKIDTTHLSPLQVKDQIVKTITDNQLLKIKR